MSALKAAILAAVLVLGVVAVACAGGEQSPPAAGLDSIGLGDGEASPGGGAMGLLSYTVPCYVAQGGRRIVASSGCTVQVSNNGIMSFDNGSSATFASGAAASFASGSSASYASGSTLSVDTSLTLGGNSRIVGHTTYATAAPAVAVTGTALAPGAALQPVSMATAGTVPLTIPNAGRHICIWNTGSQAVTIADAGNQVLAGNFALGQYDVLCGFSDGTRFIETTRSNN